MHVCMHVHACALPSCRGQLPLVCGGRVGGNDPFVIDTACCACLPVPCTLLWGGKGLNDLAWGGWG